MRYRFDESFVEERNEYDEDIIKFIKKSGLLDDLRYWNIKIDSARRVTVIPKGGNPLNVYKNDNLSVQDLMHISESELLVNINIYNSLNVNEFKRRNAYLNSLALECLGELEQIGSAVRRYFDSI